MKHLVAGSLLILIGLFLLSPLDDVLIVIPLSLIFGAWIIPLWVGIVIAMIGLGVYLTGSSKMVPNPIARHIWFFVSFGIVICAYFVYTLM
jgi:hypothetical protein